MAVTVELWALGIGIESLTPRPTSCLAVRTMKASACQVRIHRHVVKYVAEANILSEPIKLAPDPQVVHWLRPRRTV